MAHKLIDDHHCLKAKVQRVHRALQHTAIATDAADDQADAIWLRLAKETDDVLERRRILWVDVMLFLDLAPEFAAATASREWRLAGGHAHEKGARKALLVVGNVEVPLKSMQCVEVRIHAMF